MLDANLAQLGRVCLTLDPNLQFLAVHSPTLGNPLPTILRHLPPLVSVAAFFGSFDVLRVFVDLSVDPKLTDLFGRTIAHFGCAGGSFDCCRELDNYGVDFETLDHGHRLPAEYAAEFGRLDVLQWLWMRGSLNAMAAVWQKRGAEEPAILRLVAERGHADVLKFLIDVVGAPVYGNGDLPGAAQTRKLNADERAAIKKKAMLWKARQAREQEHVKVAHARLERLTTAVHAACAGGHAEALEALLERGGNPTKVDGAHRAPAILAIESGSLSCVKQLHDAGALVDQKRFLMRPAVVAARFGHLDVLRFLVDVCGFGVNDAKDEWSDSALTAAAAQQHWDCARFALRRLDGSDCDRVDVRRLRKACAAALEAGCESFLADVFAREELGRMVVGDLLSFSSLSEELSRLIVRFSTCPWFNEVLAEDGGKKIFCMAVTNADAELIKLALPFASTLDFAVASRAGWAEASVVARARKGFGLLADALAAAGATLTPEQVIELETLRSEPANVPPAGQW